MGSIKNGVQKPVSGAPARFYMPGHKGRGSLNLQNDITEIPGADNLRAPEGIIRRAMDNIAGVTGAIDAFISVNGSSGGLIALLASVCGRGGTAVIDRGCHISVINALVMFDITPVFIYPSYNSRFGINGAIEAGQVEAALAQHPEASAVLITSPTYYGVCSDIADIADTVHRCGKVLLVDEAHGAHFGFGEGIPLRAITLGADAAVQSAHKTLSCMTQGSAVLVGKRSVDTDLLQQHLSLMQTTSPSYLLMSSVEEAYVSVSRERYKFTALIKQCNELKDAAAQTGKFLPLQNSDPTRVVLHTSGDTKELERLLRTRYNVYCEMEDGHNIVLIPTIYNSQRDFEMARRGLTELAKTLPPLSGQKYDPLPKTDLALLPVDAYFSKTVRLSPADAVGKIAARAVYRTPPCMPVVCPGEYISTTVSRVLEEMETEYIDCIL